MDDDRVKAGAAAIPGLVAGICRLSRGPAMGIGSGDGCRDAGGDQCLHVCPEISDGDSDFVDGRFNVNIDGCVQPIAVVGDFYVSG